MGIVIPAAMIPPRERVSPMPAARVPKRRMPTETGSIRTSNCSARLWSRSARSRPFWSESHSSPKENASEISSSPARWLGFTNEPRRRLRPSPVTEA